MLWGLQSYGIENWKYCWIIIIGEQKLQINLKYKICENMNNIKKLEY